LGEQYHPYRGRPAGKKNFAGRLLGRFCGGTWPLARGGGARCGGIFPAQHNRRGEVLGVASFGGGWGRAGTGKRAVTSALVADLSPKRFEPWQRPWDRLLLSSKTLPARFFAPLFPPSYSSKNVGISARLVKTYCWFRGTSVLSCYGAAPLRPAMAATGAAALRRRRQWQVRSNNGRRRNFGGYQKTRSHGGAGSCSMVGQSLKCRAV